MVATSTRTIEARGLAKSFGDVVAVDGIDFTVEAGQCLGILGPNGAGKTTTIEMLEGLLEPDRGTIEVLGMTWKRDGARIRERIGVQLQQTQLYEKLRVAEVIRLFASLYPSERRKPVDEVLELVGLEEKRRAYVTELSGGQRQRLSLACALLHRPDVLFLDEPTTGLDPQGRHRMWEIVEGFKREGGTVLLTTHFMEEAERLADELLIIDHGKVLVEGTPAKIVAALQAESIIELSVAGADAAHESSPRHASTAPIAGDRSSATRGSKAVALSDTEVALLPEADVARLTGVLAVQRRGDNLRIGVQRLEQVLPSLMALVSARGLSVRELNVHRPTLEDVFLDATGRELREP